MEENHHFGQTGLGRGLPCHFFQQPFDSRCEGSLRGLGRFSAGAWTDQAEDLELTSAQGLFWNCWLDFWAWAQKALASSASSSCLLGASSSQKVPSEGRSLLACKGFLLQSRDVDQGREGGSSWLYGVLCHPLIWRVKEELGVKRKG